MGHNHYIFWLNITIGKFTYNTSSISNRVEKYATIMETWAKIVANFEMYGI